MASGLTTFDFIGWETLDVYYISPHKQPKEGDLADPDSVQVGQVKSVNDHYVHVQFYDRDGNLMPNSQACYARDLWKHVDV